MSKLDTLEPEFKMRISELLADLQIMGINCIVTSGRRTIAEQDSLYEQGRTRPGKVVTKAKGGQSPHNFGLAADLCPIRPTTNDLWWEAPDDVWNAMHMVGEKLGLRPGYDFKTQTGSSHKQNGKLDESMWCKLAQSFVDVRWDCEQCNACENGVKNVTN
jgi:peptidoglycan L-alanyl-D-glutamate endopeptidase CwlK